MNYFKVGFLGALFLFYIYFIQCMRYEERNIKCETSNGNIL